MTEHTPRARVGNRTVYIDIPIPFVNVVLICDLGRNATLGWRRKR